MDSGDFVRALKHAAVGSVVGVGVTAVAQYAAQAVNGQVAIKSSPLTTAVVQGVIGGTIGAASLLVGEQILTRFANDDPLYHMVFFFVAMRGSPVFGFQHAVNSILTTVTTQKKTPPAQTMASVAKASCSDCSKSGTSCSGCSH